MNIVLTCINHHPFQLYDFQTVIMIMHVCDVYSPIVFNIYLFFCYFQFNSFFFSFALSLLPYHNHLILIILTNKLILLLHILFYFYHSCTFSCLCWTKLAWNVMVIPIIICVMCIMYVLCICKLRLINL